MAEPTFAPENYIEMSQRFADNWLQALADARTLANDLQAALLALKRGDRPSGLKIESDLRRVQGILTRLAARAAIALDVRSQLTPKSK